MGVLQEFWGFLSTEVWPHWMGISYVIVLSVVAQVFKTRLLTASRASEYRWVFWFRRLFPIVLLVISMIVGLAFQGEVAPGVETPGERVLYFCAMGCVSMVAFNILKQWVKKKYDIDITVGNVQ